MIPQHSIQKSIYLKLWALLALFTVASIPLSAQGKLEQEQRIDLESVPETAKAWITSTFVGVRRIRWYAEETSGRQSIEAKFKYDGQRYSVEFSPTGLLEDVEIEYRLRDLPENTQQQLCETFHTLSRFKLNRIQQQWSGAPQAVKEAMQTGIIGSAELHYELEFSAFLDEHYGYWEGTFAPTGELLSYRRIILRTSDNLNY